MQYRNQTREIYMRIQSDRKAAKEMQTVKSQNKGQ